MLHITEGWVRAGRDDVTGFFGTIHNASDQSVTIRGGHSPTAERVELHDIAERGGRRVMIQLIDGITVPAGESVILAPGGLHGMLVGLHSRIEEGASIEIILGTTLGKVALVLPAHKRRA